MLTVSPCINQTYTFICILKLHYIFVMWIDFSNLANGTIQIKPYFKLNIMYGPHYKMYIREKDIYTNCPILKDNYC